MIKRQALLQSPAMPARIEAALAAQVGLPQGKAEESFEPFTQKNDDRTGLGLGLSISRRGVAFNGGVLSVRDRPGIGCAFSITLPKLAHPAPAHRIRQAWSQEAPSMAQYYVAYGADMDPKGLGLRCEIRRQSRLETMKGQLRAWNGIITLAIREDPCYPVVTAACHEIPSPGGFILAFFLRGRDPSGSARVPLAALPHPLARAHRRGLPSRRRL